LYQWCLLAAAGLPGFASTISARIPSIRRISPGFQSWVLTRRELGRRQPTRAVPPLRSGRRETAQNDRRTADCRLLIADCSGGHDRCW
jgi:hypothetical protein